ETYDQTIAQVLHELPKAPRKITPQVPVDLETICLRAMEKEQSRRFATARAMADDLRRYAQDFPIASRRVGPIGKGIRWVRRNKPKAILGVAALLLLAVTPLLVRSMHANDRRTLIEARNILLDDYRQRDTAMARADSVSVLTTLFHANEREVLTVRALADIVSNPESSRKVLASWIAAHPDDHEMIYLLAWATSKTAATHGDDRIRETEELIDRANQSAMQEGTGPGYFYRGQAQFAINLDLAVESFGKAIEAHRPAVFPQAMLHRARAMNFVMYLKRIETYFELSNDTLRALMELQPGEPYPIYLSAIAHKLHAEILAESVRDTDPNDSEQVEAAQQRLLTASKNFQTAIELATRAINEAPGRPWGAMALAHIYEAQGTTATQPDLKRVSFQKAITAWSMLTPSTLVQNPEIARDKAAYLMRLHYWVGEHDAALEQLAIRYADTKSADADRFAYAALIYAARGDLAASRAALEDGLSHFSDNSAQCLKLKACAPFCGLPFDAKPIEGSDDLPLESLIRARDVGGVTMLVAGRRADLVAIRKILASADLSTIHHNRIQSAAAFVQAASTYANDRDGAFLRLLRLSANTRDLEDYCFLAQMITQRFEMSGSPDGYPSIEQPPP
ncbi:MAG: hypothetical protein AB7N71_08675, partial [Phycisphaerae bacterium]